jgi:hypothetical protein
MAEKIKEFQHKPQIAYLKRGNTNKTMYRNTVTAKT